MKLEQRESNRDEFRTRDYSARVTPSALRQEDEEDMFFDAYESEFLANTECPQTEDVPFFEPFEEELNGNTGGFDCP